MVRVFSIVLSQDNITLFIKALNPFHINKTTLTGVHRDAHTNLHVYGVTLPPLRWFFHIGFIMKCVPVCLLQLTDTILYKVVSYVTLLEYA